MSEGLKSNIYPAALITEGTGASWEKHCICMYILEMYHLLMKVFLFLFGPSRLGLILRQDTLMIFPFQLSISVFVTWAQHGVPELIGSPIWESDLNQQTSRYWRKHETELHPQPLVEAKTWAYVREQAGSLKNPLYSSSMEAATDLIIFFHAISTTCSS